MIVQDAAEFFFPAGASWTSFTEVRLHDNHGKSAGNIDIVLVSYDDQGRVTDFGSLEVQAVYISGNIRTAFASYMSDPRGRMHMDWSGQRNYPRPDFLSSSRKRLAPQLMFKGGILNSWDKKQAVAVDKSFFSTLPELPIVPADQADIAWFVYELLFDDQTSRYKLTRINTFYTAFTATLSRITTADAPPIENFFEMPQRRLDESGTEILTQDTHALDDIVNPVERALDPNDV